MENYMYYSVIRVLRKEDGSVENCELENTFIDSAMAQNYTRSLNRFYGSKTLSWIIDKY